MYVFVAILGGSERKEVWSWKWIRDWRDAAGYQQVPININVCCRLEAAELAEVTRKKNRSRRAATRKLALDEKYSVSAITGR